MALELVLRSLLNCKKFVNSTSDEKNWLAVAKLVPGTSPKQCAKKWEEMCEKSWFVKPAVLSTQTSSDLNLNAVIDYLLHRKDSEESSEEMRIDDQDSTPHDKSSLSEKIQEQEHCSKLAKTEITVEQKKDKDSLPGSAKKLKPKPLSPEGPNMVIHVCDESKNLKQDFSCARDLLVKEMKYFAEYLSLEPQRWEEVDISVHCDVQIFDWLMRYVKRDITSNEDIVPKLEPSNVISILISSDFLRMDSLVTKCIHYCHANMSAILSTPCNMNCINDKLVTRISNLFNHAELDTVKDRKDKFKSKLFCKKIEEFVEPQPLESDSRPDNASTLFRCASCKKLLTADNQAKVPCVLSRMKIDSRGQMSYGHSRDVSWDINDHLVNLKEKLKSWGDVYWRLWGATTIMFCHHCHSYFPCTELGHCRYHTLSAKYKEMEQDDDSLLIGIYPCCQKKSLRYDSIGVYTGCHVKDHILEAQVRFTVSSEKTEDNQNKEDSNSTEDEASASTESEDDDLDETEQRKPSNGVTNDPSVIKDLLAHRDIICVPFQRLASARASELNVFYDDESAGNWKPPGVVTQRFSGHVTIAERKTTNDPATALPPIRRSKTSISQRMPSSRRKTAILKNSYSHSTEEDEEEDEDSERYQAMKGIQQVKKKPSSESRQSSTGFKWDPQRSQRWNQDAQREEDSKRMTEVINAMAKQRSAANQEKKQKSKEFSGGIFHKLDHQFRVSTQPPVIKHQTSNNQLAAGPRTRRAVVKT